MPLKIPKPIVYISIRNGLIASLINIGALLLLFYGGKHPLLLSPLIDIRIPLYGVFIFFGLKVYRDQSNGGALGFVQGIVLGFFCYMTIAILTSIFIFLFASIEQTQFISKYIDIAMDQLIHNRELFIDSIGENAYRKSIEMLPNTTAANLAIDYFLKSMPIGLFLTIVLAILQRRKTLI